MAAAGEYVVQRVGKIRRGVNKRTVEIEDDGGALQHWSSVTRALRARKRRRRERRVMDRFQHRSGENLAQD
jgi:hypothetical protein